MKNKFYAEIFNHSGAWYHLANQLFPHARDEEFKAALSLLSLEDHSRVLDVPAGGGYLYDYIGSLVSYSAFDFSTEFAKSRRVKLCSETHIPVDDSYFDTAVSLASLHHVKDKAHFISELRRSLKTGGQLLIGDVVAGSKESIFLNGFVNDWNTLGHNGDFLCMERDVQLLNKIGFATQTVIKDYYWNFDSEPACHEYLRLLFALDKTPAETLLNEAISELGITKTNAGFHLHWSLGFILATAT